MELENVKHRKWSCIGFLKLFNRYYKTYCQENGQILGTDQNTPEANFRKNNLLSKEKFTWANLADVILFESEVAKTKPMVTESPWGNPIRSQIVFESNCKLRVTTGRLETFNIIVHPSVRNTHCNQERTFIHKIMCEISIYFSVYFSDKLFFTGTSNATNKQVA